MTEWEDIPENTQMRIRQASLTIFKFVTEYTVSHQFWCSIDCSVVELCVRGACVEKPFPRFVVGNGCITNNDCSANEECDFGKCISMSPRNPLSRFVAPKACSTGADCGSQSVCVDGNCVVDNGYGGKCSVGAHCPNGYNCVNARCVPSSRRFERTFRVNCPIGTWCQNTSCLPFPGK
ncbi:hypothetical protein CRE_16196 [Caenorhabditis remanei]|uniref:DUF7107 domain-containing protein n=1 Tax=Caenorhabditis remanei TaxID=31234 RepID=E3MSI6_CAERE|nr:hypothetical protein CRE_16196 [Caenorhabditis remanei]